MSKRQSPKPRPDKNLPVFIRKPKLRLIDLQSEALAGLVQRPERSALTMLGTILGIAAFVAVLGLTATAGGQIDKRFNMLAATEVTVQDVGGTNLGEQDLTFPDDASAKIKQINGVTEAGVHWMVRTDGLAIAAIPVVNGQATGGGINLHAASPSALKAMHPSLHMGRLYDDFHANRAERVAVLGAGAAARLGITRLDSNPAVFLDGTPYTILGVIDAFERKSELLLAVIIPTGTAYRDFHRPTNPRAEMIIETRPGAAKVVADQAALALRPDAPTRLKVIAPIDPKTLRTSVSADLNTLFLLLAGISLILGATGIANTTLVSVLERTNEIGLRRSLGAKPVHIAMQFLVESTSLGLLGGLIGTSLGVAIVVVTSVAKEWTAVLAPWTVGVGPIIGASVGLIAGAYPALRAARIEPADALRR